MAQINWPDWSANLFLELRCGTNSTDIFIDWITSKTLPIWAGAGVYLWQTMHAVTMASLILHVARALESHLPLLIHLIVFTFNYSYTWLTSPNWRSGIWLLNKRYLQIISSIIELENITEINIHLYIMRLSITYKYIKSDT